MIGTLNNLKHLPPWLPTLPMPWPIVTGKNTLSPLCGGDRGVVGVDGVVLWGDDASISAASSLIEPNVALNGNDACFCVKCFAVMGLIPGDFNGNSVFLA